MVKKPHSIIPEQGQFSKGYIMAKRKAFKAKSGILWQGSSMIDGSPIVCVMIVSSSNTKTGNMVQTHIIRADVDPLTANRTGLDRAICGDCPHRGKADPTASKGLAVGRSCYVNIGQGPLGVFRKFKAGGYPTLTPDEIRQNVTGRMVRIGSYGDGAAVPASVWQGIKEYAQGVTAYTHQGLNQANHYMVSADSLAVAQSAWNTGKRTFRIVQDYSERQPNEVPCPSSKGIQCIDCGLCDGSTQAKSVVIQVHGIGAKHFQG